MMEGAASGSWDNYHILGENTLVIFLMTFMIFLETFASRLRLLDAWIPDKQEFTVLVNL
jgi:hypothetical protein